MKERVVGICLRSVHPRLALPPLVTFLVIAPLELQPLNTQHITNKPTRAQIIIVSRLNA
jgi:hypothetical protein